MRHGFMYNGAFETNYPRLTHGTDSYVSTDGSEVKLRAWPADIDGVHVGYMEKAGKKFFAVRVQYGAHDIILQKPVAIDQMRHLANKRFSADPMMVGDDEASALLDDVIRDNPDRQMDVAMMINEINQVRRGARTSAP